MTLVGEALRGDQEHIDLVPFEAALDLAPLPHVAGVDRDGLEPKACRQRVLDRFDVAQMAEGYERVYRRVAG